MYDYLRGIAKVRKVDSLYDIKYDWELEVTCGEFVFKDDVGYIERLLKSYRGGRDV